MAAPGDIAENKLLQRGPANGAGPCREFELREQSKIEFAGALSSLFLSYISAIPGALVKASMGAIRPKKAVPLRGSAASRQCRFEAVPLRGSAASRQCRFEAVPLRGIRFEAVPLRLAALQAHASCQYCAKPKTPTNCLSSVQTRSTRQPCCPASFVKSAMLYLRELSVCIVSPAENSKVRPDTVTL